MLKLIFTQTETNALKSCFFYSSEMKSYSWWRGLSNGILACFYKYFLSINSNLHHQEQFLLLYSIAIWDFYLYICMLWRIAAKILVAVQVVIDQLCSHTFHWTTHFQQFLNSILIVFNSVLFSGNQQTPWALWLLKYCGMLLVYWYSFYKACSWGASIS